MRGAFSRYLMPLFILRVTQSPDWTISRTASAWKESASSNSAGRVIVAMKIADHSSDKNSRVEECPGLIRTLDPAPGAFHVNQVEIPEVYDETAPLSENEHGVLFQYGIDEKQPAAADAEIPEGERDYAFALPLAGNPLDQKSAEKESLAAEPRE